MPRASITPELLKKASALLAKGHSRTEVAAKLGIGKSQLYVALPPGRAAPAPARAPRVRAQKPTHVPATEAPPEEEPTPLGTDDDLVILDEALKAARVALKAAARDGNYGKAKPLVETIALVVKQRRLMAPPVAPTPEELEAKSRPRADDVLAKIRDGIGAVARGEAKTGRCARCQAHLTPEQIEQRRAAGGIEEEPEKPAATAAEATVEAPG